MEECVEAGEKQGEEQEVIVRAGVREVVENGLEVFSGESALPSLRASVQTLAASQSAAD
jgi:hypothetical protein